MLTVAPVTPPTCQQSWRYHRAEPPVDADDAIAVGAGGANACIVRDAEKNCANGSTAPNNCSAAPLAGEPQ